MAVTKTRTAVVSIDGNVQGVGFRAWTQAMARELGLSGWVRNEEDGRVSAVLEGGDDEVQTMLDRMQRGPAEAEVDEVESREGAPSGLRSFEIRH